MKAYLFPGQGAQFPGMGKDLYENLTKPGTCLNPPMKSLAFE
jgi:[acyl-carrier-protein] S-malonyltransferase